MLAFVLVSCYIVFVKRAKSAYDENKIKLLQKMFDKVFYLLYIVCINRKGKNLAKKKYFLVVDTETTMTDRVADFGAVLCDKQGNIVSKCGALVRDFFMDRDKHVLFHNTSIDPLWGKANLEKRYQDYENMLASGKRMLASVAAINKWLQTALRYDPTWTAYNKAFDRDKLTKSGIDMSIFNSEFCLWQAAAARWANTKPYKNFVLEHGFVKPRTKTGKQTYTTNADVMARFILDDPNMTEEPHTALEDAEFYELPILKALVNSTSPKAYMNPPPVSWQRYQIKDHFQPK